MHLPALVRVMTHVTSRTGSPLACASPSVFVQEGRITKAGKKHLSEVLPSLREAQGASADGCTSCLQLMEDLRAEDLLRFTGGNVHNHAMRVCEGRLDEVERLFAELIEMRMVTEASYAMLVQAQVEHGELQRARASIEAMLVDARVSKPRLRTCAPLLHRLCQMGDAEAMIDLWDRLARRGVEYTAREFDMRMRMHGRAGDTRALQRALSALLTHDPTPDAKSIEAITAAVSDWASARVRGPHGEESADAGETGEVVGRLWARRATLGASGACSCCGSSVRLLSLAPDERARVRETLLRRAGERSSTGFRHLLEYVEWLRVRPPFDYVLDGPNIAYFNQNFEEGSFRFAQIQAVVDVLREASPEARILLLLPAKYLKAEIPNHTSSKSRQRGSKQRTKLTDADWALIAEWRASGILYEATPELYDDWYWMYASVAETQAAEPETATVPPAGVTRVVTNDAMRDHFDQLLPSRSFHRWRHAQILPFGFHHANTTEAHVAGSSPPEAEVGADASATIHAEHENTPAGRAGSLAPVASEAATATDHGPAPGMATAELSEPMAANEAVHGLGHDEAAATAAMLRAEALGHEGQVRMRAAGLDGPLRTWVAPVPRLSVEAQADGWTWHVPVPDTEPQEWLCVRLPQDEEGKDQGATDELAAVEAASVLPAE